MTESIRERYENPEMEPGSVGRPTALVLVVAMALVVLAVPVWRQVTTGTADAFSALVESRPDPRVTASVLAANQRLLEGIDTFETRLEEGSPLRPLVRPTAQWALLRFGGVGHETVYAGPRGWLVLRSGFDHVVGPPFLDPGVLERRRRAVESWRPAIEPDPRPAIRDLHRQLEARGIELVLLPVPTKPAIHPEALGAAFDGVAAEEGARNPSLDPFLREMEATGARVFDPAPILRDMARAGEAAYLRTDSHWSPAAMERVAAALADRLDEWSLEGWIDLGETDSGEAVAWSRTPLERTGRGDLWRLLDLPADRPLYPEETVTIHEVTSWDGLLFEPDPRAPVLLLGDSFSLVYSDSNLHWGRAAGFAEQLAYSLGRGIDRLARPDGSSDQVRRDLARQPDRLDAKAVVIYQFAARELSVGDWPLVEIPWAW